MSFRALRTMLQNRRNREQIYSRSEYWDAKASTLRGHAVSMWPNNNLNELYQQEQLSLIDSFLPDLKDKRILDLGCGTGRLSRAFASKGAVVTGTDFSAKAIGIAQQSSEGNNPTYRTESLFDLSDESSYDYIFCWGVLTVACRNVGELRDAARRIRKALCPGGSLVLLEPIHRGFLHRVLNMSVRDFVNVLKESGLRIERTPTALHFWPARLALSYVRWPMWLTSPVYRVGQWLMKTFFRGRTMGDYTGIVAMNEE